MNQRLQVHLTLARASNLPTVVSNVVCACLLSGQFTWLTTLCAAIAASLLYTGGIYLNDWKDADYDYKHRPERPIPAQQITRSAVGLWAAAYFLLGLSISCLINLSSFVWIVLLLACIIAYDLHHKENVYSPLLMAGCRALIYPWGASLQSDGLSTGIAIAAIAAFSYTVGLSWIARKPSFCRQNPFRMSLLLAVPALLWLGYTWPSLSAASVALLLAFALWTAYSLSGLYRKLMQVGFTVQNLIAGLCVVDLLAIGFSGLLSPLSVLCFGTLLLTTVLLQLKISGS